MAYKPTDKVQTEVVHVVQENGVPDIVIFKSKNGGSVQLFRLTPLSFDEVKVFLEDLGRSSEEIRGAEGEDGL